MTSTTYVLSSQHISFHNFVLLVINTVLKQDFEYKISQNISAETAVSRNPTGYSPENKTIKWVGNVIFP